MNSPSCQRDHASRKRTISFPVSGKVLLVSPLQHWLLLLTWLRVPGPTVLPQTPALSPLGTEPLALLSLHAQAGAAAGQGRQDSLAAGGVHQQRDEGGGGRADAVQCQHGVFALLFADDVI